METRNENENRIPQGDFLRFAPVAILGLPGKELKFRDVVTYLEKPPAVADGFFRQRKRAKLSLDSLMLALPIFTASHPATIVGVHELNFCVRDGNRWTLMTINTNY